MDMMSSALRLRCPVPILSDAKEYGHLKQKIDAKGMKARAERIIGRACQAEY